MTVDVPEKLNDPKKYDISLNCHVFSEIVGVKTYRPYDKNPITEINANSFVNIKFFFR
jgi:hypothetical protein